MLQVLKAIEKDVTRIQVIDKSGRTCWRKPSEVEYGDTPVINGNGDPVLMRGSIGRKPKNQTVKRQPVNEGAADLVKAKERHFKTDKLLKALKRDPESDAVLDIVMMALAEEACSLSFERREAELKGADTSSLSLRRSKILKSIGETWLKRREKIEVGGLDIESQPFQIVFGFLMETLREVMKESGVRQEHVETVFSRLGKRLSSGWKDEAKARIREGK
jgi:hypothetical protein